VKLFAAASPGKGWSQFVALAGHMLYFLVIVCLFGCFSAAQGDSQCLTSTRALMATTSCYEAVGNVTQRTQDAMQFAMACTNGEQCKDLWRAMINDCNPVSLQVCMSH